LIGTISVLQELKDMADDEYVHFTSSYWLLLYRIITFFWDRLMPA